MLMLSHCTCPLRHPPAAIHAAHQEETNVRGLALINDLAFRLSRGLVSTRLKKVRFACKAVDNNFIQSFFFSLLRLFFFLVDFHI